MSIKRNTLDTCYTLKVGKSCVFFFIIIFYLFILCVKWSWRGRVSFSPLFWSLLQSQWDAVFTRRENKHTLRQNALCLCKLLLYIKIPCGICSKGFWSKMFMFTHYRYSQTQDFPFITLSQENVDSQKKFRTSSSTQKYILGCSKFWVPDYFILIFFGKKRSSEVWKYYLLISLQREKQHVRDDRKCLCFPVLSHTGI